MSALPSKILLATDGSPEAERAAGMAGELSRDLGAELHLLYVRPIPKAYINQWYMAEPEFVNELSRTAGEEAGEKAEEEARKVGEMGIEVAGVRAEVGRPDEEIVRLAEEIGAEIVVVGSRGHGALRRALMGSVSMSVVRHAHGSVLVVRGEPGGEGYLPGRILLAVDGSKEAEAAAGMAEEISRATGSDLHLVHVLHDAPPAPYPHPLAREGWERHLEEVRQNARTFVEERAGRIEEAGGRVAGAEVVSGEPDREIVRKAEELGAGLVVTGSRGMGGVRRALMGSVSDSVVRHAHCPVLVVRDRTG